MARKSTKKSKRRNYHHGDAREALIEAAAELIAERGGPEAFSLREAARHIGIDPAACYRHFRNRGEVLVAVGQHGFAQFAELMSQQRARAPEDDPVAGLLALGRAYVEFGIDHPAYFKVMFGGSGKQSRDPSLRLPSVERSAYEQLEREIRAWATTRGSVVDVEYVALMLWSAVHGVTRLVVDGALPLTKTTVESLTKDLTLSVLSRAAATNVSDKKV